MEFVHVFVMTSLAFDKNGEVRSRNVAVTFDLFEAEDYRTKGVENDYDTFVVPCDWVFDRADQFDLSDEDCRLYGLLKEPDSL